MIQYDNFYRRFGLRNANQLLQPPLPTVGRFELPPLSAVHYLGKGPNDSGPSKQLLLYQKNEKPIRIEHVFELSETAGNPRRTPVDLAGIAREFRRSNPDFRPAVDLEVLKRESRAIHTVNYSYLHRIYKYQRSVFAPVFRWQNIIRTMFSRLRPISRHGYRQYIEFVIPKVLPSVQDLNKAAAGWTNKTIQQFSSPELIFLLEVWKWLGEDRLKSALYQHIGHDPKGIHFVFREGDRFSVLDLELLNSWRKVTTAELNANAEERREDPSAPALSSRGQVAAGLIQKRFLRLLMGVMEARKGLVEENLGDSQEVASVSEEEVVGSMHDDKAVVVDSEELTEAAAFKGYDESLDNANLQAEIDQDLDALDAIQSGFSETEFFDTPANVSDEFDEPADIDSADSSIAIVRPPEIASDANSIRFFPTEDDVALKEMIARAAENGAITAADYRRLVESVDVFKTIPAPLGNEGTLATFSKIDPALLKITEVPSIPDQPTIVDKSMLKSSLMMFDKKYAKEVMQRDMAALASSLQRAGIVVRNYDVEEVEDITGSHYVYRINIKPIEGSASTLVMKMPKVDDEGNFKINGVNYRTRKQRGDMPIRKISPSKVALTSYYGKIFTERSERRVNDYGKWLRNHVMAAGLDAGNEVITNVVPGRAHNPAEKTPRLFSTIAMGFRSFDLKIAGSVYHCDFTQVSRSRNAGALRGAVKFATGDEGTLYIDGDNNIYRHSTDGTIAPMPSFEEALGINPNKAPVEFAELKVFGKMIPVGVVLGYLLGFENVLKLANPTSMREVPVGKRLNLEADEWAMAFDDKSLVFSRKDQLATMLLAGWRDFDQTTTRFPMEEFNNKDVYFNLFEEKKLGVRYIRELDLLEQMFIDPITRDILVEMKEPTVFTKLLVRAAELICTDDHPDEQDTSLTRIKSYERFVGAAYSELVRSIRIHNGRPGKQRYGVELNPYAVWIAIQQDPAKDQVSEINPVQNLKESEAVTYSGTGGRGSRSMVKSTRLYHRNDMGVISESTVDSSDVAINIFTSANPKFNSLRGTADRFDMQNDGPTSLMSTSSLLSPGATRDDPKRVNFIGIQNRHVVACEGYRQALLRTGYEQVIPHRVGDMFAVTAKQPGKVVHFTKDGMIVEYADGTRQGITLGRRYGNASGLTIPHTIVTDMVMGQSFEVGEPLAYNKGFFERDALNPKQIIWKSAMLAKTVLFESPDTLEDSCAISQRLSERMVTEQTKIKDIIVNFDQEIHKMVQEGQAVEPESILCIIEDALSARAGLLDEDALDTLRVLSANTPQAKLRGRVERIEVYYNGELEDMSDSLRALAEASDKSMAARNTSIGRKAFTGSVGDEFRVGTDPLLLDTACIRVYMTSRVNAGVGDKGVFCNQLKTVIGRKFNNNVRTESGVEIDAIFGAKSVADRIVTSPDLIGTTTTLLLVATKRVIRAYQS